MLRASGPGSSRYHPQEPDCKGHLSGIRPHPPTWREVRAKLPLVCARLPHASNLQPQRRRPPTFKRIVHSFRRPLNPSREESCRCIPNSQPSFKHHHPPSTPRSSLTSVYFDKTRRHPRSPSLQAHIRIGQTRDERLCQATPFRSPRQPTTSRREVISSRTSQAGEEVPARL